MKGFPKTYDRFIQKMLLELKRDPYTFVTISKKQSCGKHGWYDYARVSIIQQNSDGTYTPSLIVPGMNFVFKRSKESEEERYNEWLAIYYARQVQKAIPETTARINRMIAGCPYIGELKCGWVFRLNGVTMKLLRYDSENKAYLVSLLDQNDKKVYLDAKKFRRVAVELDGYFGTKKVYKVVPKKENYPIITDVREFVSSIRGSTDNGE